MFLDPTQSMAHGIGMANKDLGDTAHRCVVVLPHLKRLEQHLALGDGEVAKGVRCVSNQFHLQNRCW